jgi:hypothetical protein
MTALLRVGLLLLLLLTGCLYYHRWSRPGATEQDAFAILGACTKALRLASYTTEERDAFIAEATSGDYDQVLRTAMKRFEVDDGRARSHTAALVAAWAHMSTSTRSSADAGPTAPASLRSS